MYESKIYNYLHYTYLFSAIFFFFERSELTLSASCRKVRFCNKNIGLIKKSTTGLVLMK